MMTGFKWLIAACATTLACQAWASHFCVGCSPEHRQRMQEWAREMVDQYAEKFTPEERRVADLYVRTYDWDPKTELAGLVECMEELRFAESLDPKAADVLGRYFRRSIDGLSSDEVPDVVTQLVEASDAIGADDKRRIFSTHAAESNWAAEALVDLTRKEDSLDEAVLLCKEQIAQGNERFLTPLIGLRMAQQQGLLGEELFVTEMEVEDPSSIYPYDLAVAVQEAIQGLHRDSKLVFDLYPKFENYPPSSYASYEFRLVFYQECLAVLEEARGAAHEDTVEYHKKRLRTNIERLASVAHFRMLGMNRAKS